MKHIQQVLFQMHVSKCPLDVSSCVSKQGSQTQHVPNQTPDLPSKTCSSCSPPYLNICKSILLPVTPLFLSCSTAHLSVTLVGFHLQNISKYVQHAPPLLAPRSKLFSNPFPTQQSEGKFSHINQTLPPPHTHQRLPATQVILSFLKQCPVYSCLLHGHSIFVSLLTLPLEREQRLGLSCLLLCCSIPRA